MSAHYAIVRATGFGEQDRILIEKAARAAGLLFDDFETSSRGLFSIRFLPALDREGARAALGRAGADDMLCCAVSAADWAVCAELLERPDIALVPYPFERAALARWFEGLLRRVGLCREARQALYGAEGISLAVAWRADALHVPGAARFGASLVAMAGGFGEREAEEVFLALEEGLVNAVEHGSLGLDSALKPDNLQSEDAYEELRRQRLADEAYGARMVRMDIQCGEGSAEVRIGDEGEGFDAAGRISAEAEPGKAGMGFALMRRAFDAVRYDRGARELVLSLRYGRGDKGATMVGSADERG